MPKKSRDVMVASSDWTVPTADGVHRRTIVKGAAWSVPVVAVAIGTPAAAASNFTCPVLTAADYTKESNGYAYADSATIGVQGTKPQAFRVNSDNSSAAGSGAEGVIAFTAQMKVVKGKTYTFSYSAYGNYGNFTKEGSRSQYFRLKVDGAKISPNYGTRTSEFGDTQLPIQEKSTDTLPWKDYTVSYTATADGTVPVRFEFVLPSKLTGQSANDDVFVTLPTIACS